MQLIRRLHLPALFCAFSVLVCALISRPYANMGIADDGPYIITAQTLAATGHIAYNGWAAPILGWQLYLGAASIRLFGDPFTSARMSILLVAVAMAFVLQRTTVRLGMTERNATIGVLALVLSPLYLMLSVTFMSDICGLFAIVVCLYGCVRALQASSVRTTIAWLCFAVAANAIFGTARQIGWLGVLVIVPSTLWLLRARRGVVLVGGAATVAGAIFIFACLHWFKQQPYYIPEHLLVSHFSAAHLLGQLFHLFLDVPFLLLPIAALFLPQLRNSRRGYVFLLASFFVCYVLLVVHAGRFLFLQPGGLGSMGLNIHGMFDYTRLKGEQPVLLPTWIQILLTIVSVGGLMGLIGSWRRGGVTESEAAVRYSVTRREFSTLLAPFTLVYILLLLPRGGNFRIYERYALPLLVIALFYLLRYYQERIRLEIPFMCLIVIAVMATLGIAVTHNTFAFYRARVALADELRAGGIPDTSVDNGWEYNFGVELQHADHINEDDIVLPANGYVPSPPPPAGTCSMFFYDETPHIHPLLGVSFEPDACYGPAGFAPVRYSRWLARRPGELYVVRYTASSQRVN